MSTAQKTKSTSEVTSSTFAASRTVMLFTVSGIGQEKAQRPETASSYVLPALRAEAASTAISNQG